MARLVLALILEWRTGE